MSVIEIRSEEQFTELTSQSDPKQLIALYFHTPWASPCVQMNTVYTTLAEANPSTVFISINAEDHPQISEIFDVSAVPFFVLIQNGTILKELSGADPKEFITSLNQFQEQSTSYPSGAPGAAAINSSSTSTSNAGNGNGNSSIGQTQFQSQKINSVNAQQQNQDAESESESEEKLNERLKKLTSAAPVMLFMKGTPASPQCGFSRQLVAILRENQVRFGFFDILKDDGVRQGLKKFSDWPTFPQLYINGTFQGGLDIIKESIEDDSEFFNKALNNEI
ncbi:hypothetical protein PACTADRAFT_48410 [Pachysolen tannophilus NRRL Y-2460]|uniref:Thioredoxin domain-containing protein n=1 Tax=Pachysolen tannophilus NRRL Y-2460 TaxID=669874 RepID=A0A1E4TXX1_PACTA|nr:hypothetical protein PACTADRAFT_48410 [Pachysolen tannophilus NRRL Y-2460]